MGGGQYFIEDTLDYFAFVFIALLAYFFVCSFRIFFTILLLFLFLFTWSCCFFFTLIFALILFLFVFVSLI